MTKRYRSKFERTTARDLAARGCTKFKYEPTRYEYYKLHTYTPDFLLPNGIYIETKGRFLPSDRAKILLVKEEHPELDLRMVFMVDNPLRKGSKTRYSDWCEKHDIPYAIGTIPQEWIDE